MIERDELIVIGQMQVKLERDPITGTWGRRLHRGVNSWEELRILPDDPLELVENLLYVERYGGEKREALIRLSQDGQIISIHHANAAGDFLEPLHEYTLPFGHPIHKYLRVHHPFGKRSQKPNKASPFSDGIELGEWFGQARILMRTGDLDDLPPLFIKPEYQVLVEGFALELSESSVLGAELKIEDQGGDKLRCRLHHKRSDWQLPEDPEAREAAIKHINMWAQFIIDSSDALKRLQTTPAGQTEEPQHEVAGIARHLAAPYFKLDLPEPYGKSPQSFKDSFNKD